MDLEQSLAVPVNREKVLSIASRVLLALAPSGDELELGHLEPLIDLAVKDEVIVADRWDVAGRFGNVDLLGPLIVPLVVQAVRRSGGSTATVTVEEVKSMVRRTRSPQGLRQGLHAAVGKREIVDDRSEDYGSALGAQFFL